MINKNDYEHVYVVCFDSNNRIERTILCHKKFASDYCRELKRQEFSVNIFTFEEYIAIQNAQENERL